MLLRGIVTSFLSLATALFAFVAAHGVTRSNWESAAIALIAAGLAGQWALRTPHLDFRDGAHPRLLRMAAAATALVAMVLLGRMSGFMLDSTKGDLSFVPSSRWEREHSCLTAYYAAAEAARSGANVYDDALYSAPDDDPTQPRKPAMRDGFQVDVYEYPPPFLLLPRALLTLTPGFLDMRQLWFGLSGLVLLAAIVIVAIQLGPETGARALLWSPFIWIAPPTLSLMQKENVQGTIVAIAMVAMVLFARGKPVPGGLLLAFATASKLYPGLLIVYLIVRRQWRAVAWTAGFGVALSALTWAVFGWAAYATFFDHLPGLLSGEAFPAFRRPIAMAINLGIPGLVFKLRLLGIEGLGFGASKVVGWAYALAALAAVVYVARRNLNLAEQAMAWLAILVLATLRSPFLPSGYAAVPVLWLLTLLASAWVAHLCRPLVFVPVWLALCVYWPTDWPADPRWIAALHLLPQIAIVAVAVIALRPWESSSVASESTTIVLAS